MTNTGSMGKHARATGFQMVQRRLHHHQYWHCCYQWTCPLTSIRLACHKGQPQHTPAATDECMLAEEPIVPDTASNESMEHSTQSTHEPPATCLCNLLALHHQRSVKLLKHNMQLIWLNEHPSGRVGLLGPSLSGNSDNCTMHIMSSRPHQWAGLCWSSNDVGHQLG